MITNENGNIMVIMFTCLDLITLVCSVEGLT